jgi:large subunit ribosomal protein L9
MAQVKILLLKPLKGHGEEGEIVHVRAGFARNFLIPQKKALLASRANEKQVAALCQARKRREENELKAAQALAEKIQAVTLTIAVKTGEGGKLFGSVSGNDILERYKAEGVTFDKDCLRLPQPIKKLGSHPFQVVLHKDVQLQVAVEVVSENPIE